MNRNVRDTPKLVWKSSVGSCQTERLSFLRIRLGREKYDCAPGHVSQRRSSDPGEGSQYGHHRPKSGSSVANAPNKFRHGTGSARDMFGCRDMRERTDSRS